MKAMILAAGFGTRLGELTKNTPKCLVDVDGRPIIRLVAENLAKAGVTEVIINLHYLPDAVEQYCSSELSDLFDKIEFSREPEILGTGGGLKATKQFFEDQEYFYLVNADIFSDFDLALLLKQVKLQASTDNKLLGALAVMDRKDSTYLTFSHSSIFKGWVKAADQVSSDILVKAFCGIQLLSPDIFSYLDQNQAKSFSIIESYCDASASGQQLLAVDIGSSNWFDMGTVEQLEALRNHLKS